MTKLKQKYGLLIIGITLGILYGLASRMVMGANANLTTLSFMFLIPSILGIIPLMFADHQKLKSYRNIIFIPWLTVAAFFVVTLIFGIEDFLCLLVMAAPYFVFATLSALIFRFFQINKKKKKGKLLTLVLLPFLLAPIEGYFKGPTDTFSVKSEVLITAKPEIIWDNIVEVKTIDENEYHPGLFNLVGIPRPINASVDKKEVGGKRIGNFEGGLKFLETITEYEENKKVSFNIKIDSNSVRQKVFDQHVLKGNYFSFVDASYQLKEIKDGEVKLTLTSRYQLSSNINFYAELWGEAMLKDFQDRLLEVIQSRCEVVANANYGK